MIGKSDFQIPDIFIRIEMSSDSLSITGRQENDIYQISKYHRSVEILKVTSTNIIGLTIPDVCTSLRELYVYGNDQLKWIDISDKCENLIIISCTGNKWLQKIPLKSTFSRLEKLILHSNYLAYVKIPKGLNSLKKIHVSHNTFTSASIIRTGLVISKSISSLKIIKCQYTKLRTLTIPRGCTSLEKLDVSFSDYLETLRLPYCPLINLKRLSTPIEDDNLNDIFVESEKEWIDREHSGHGWFACGICGRWKRWEDFRFQPFHGGDRNSCRECDPGPLRLDYLDSDWRKPIQQTGECQNCYTRQSLGNLFTCQKCHENFCKGCYTYHHFVKCRNCGKELPREMVDETRCWSCREYLKLKSNF